MNDLLYVDMLDNNQRYIPDCILCGSSTTTETQTGRGRDEYVPPADGGAPAKAEPAGLWASIVRWFAGD